jgi:hypothetical protein
MEINKMNLLMKKILLLPLMFSTTVCSAQTMVEVFWPFSIASTTTNYVRLVLDQANNNQQDYRFILVQKTGAGGFVAAQAAKTSGKPALLATSNAFFIRPYLFPEQTYQFSEFVPVLAMGSMPMVFIGNSKVSWGALVKKDKIFIGVPGLGSFSHVLATHLKERYPQVEVVPYPGPTEAQKDVIGGNIDLYLDVPRMGLAQQPLVQLHYITGSNDYKQLNLAAGNINKKFADLNLEFAILAPQSMDAKLVNTLSKILITAQENNPKLQDLYREDFVTAISNKNLNKWYQMNIQNWKKHTQNVRIEK